MNTLAAGSLRLEPQLEGHALEMFTVLSDPAIYEFENQPPQSLAWLQDRFRRLETRRSADGQEQWLNWVVRLPDGQLAGYVQASVLSDCRAYVAYELGSQYWRQGIASAALTAVIEELGRTYQVSLCIAVFKTANFRSQALLRRLAFGEVPPSGVAPVPVEADERAMYKACGGHQDAVS